jgi:DNA-binding NtrC family response regulator
MSPTYDAVLNPSSPPPKGERVSILTVISDPEERRGLLSQLRRCKWDIQSVASFEHALARLRRSAVGVVVAQYRPCGRLSWRTLLDELRRTTPPPRLVVTDRLADEVMWMEAMRLGAHDMLTQPFAQDEVFRVVAHAWCTWKTECGLLRLSDGHVA